MPAPTYPVGQPYHVSFPSLSLPPGRSPPPGPPSGPAATPDPSPSGFPFLGFWPSGRPLHYKGDAHLLTVARPGAGKGRSVILPNLACYTGSVVALDPKADLATACARWREEKLGQVVYVVDPFHAVPDELLPSNGRATFNPVMMIRNNQAPLAAAYQVAEALIIPGEKEPHFDTKAQGWLAALLLYVATSERFPDDLRTLETVWRIFTDFRVSRSALRGMMEDSDMFIAGEAAAMLGVEVELGPEGDLVARPAENAKELDTVRSSFRNQLLKTMSEPAIHAATSGGSVGIDFGGLSRKPATVFICLPGKLASVHARFMRLLLSCGLSEIEDAGLVDLLPDGSRSPSTLFIMDEFATLGRLPVVTEAMGRMRGYGLKFWTVVQTLSQLKKLYGDSWDEITGNAGMVQYFGGTNDVFSSEYISKLSGEKTQIVGGQSGGNDALNQGGWSKGLDGRPVVFPGQVRSWPNGEQLVMMLGASGPINAKLAKLDHSEFPAFRDFKPRPRPSAPPLRLVGPS